MKYPGYGFPRTEYVVYKRSPSPSMEAGMLVDACIPVGESLGNPDVVYPEIFGPVKTRTRTRIGWNPPVPVAYADKNRVHAYRYENNTSQVD